MTLDKFLKKHPSVAMSEYGLFRYCYDTAEEYLVTSTDDLPHSLKLAGFMYCCDLDSFKVYGKREDELGYIAVLVTDSIDLEMVAKSGIKRSTAQTVVSIWNCLHNKK